MIFYRFLFNNMEMLSINEKLIYSVLIDYSIKLSEDFYVDGSLDSEYLKDYINVYANGKEYGSIPFILPSLHKVARDLEITRNTLKKVLKRFKDIRLITQNRIVCHKNLFDSGYITVPSGSGIKGQLLVFYSFLLDRSSHFNWVIDTWASRLEELTGIEKGSIQDMLYKLHKKGLVQRLPNNKLKINRIDEN